MSQSSRGGGGGGECAQGGCCPEERSPWPEPVQIGTRLDTVLPSKSLLSSWKSRDWQCCCLGQALVRSMVLFADVPALTYLTLLAEAAHERVAFEHRPKEIEK